MPYERFSAYGPGSLTNAELLALILRTGTRSLSATQLADQILKLKDPDNSSFKVLFELSMEDLLAVRGIGEVKAVKILCLSEIARRIGQDQARKKLSFQNPSSVADYYMESLRHKDQEHCILMMLDNRLSLIRDEILYIGTANLTVVSSRDIYRKALQAGAVRIMLIHNHPSGDPTPSRQDIEISEKIREAGELLDIELLDHLIIGDGCYSSLREAGYIQ